MTVVEMETHSRYNNIPNEHLMDSLWFEIDELAPRPILGTFGFTIPTPIHLGNTIMIEHKRLAHTKEVLWGDNPPEWNST
jgi:hypothetical protein